RWKPVGGEGGTLMRKLMCLMLLLSGLSVGCSDDDNGNGGAATDGDETTDEVIDPATGDEEVPADGDNGGDDLSIPDDPSNGGDDGADMEIEPKYPECVVRGQLPA